MTPVRTVRGVVDVPDGTVVDAHAHLWIDRPAGLGPGPALRDLVGATAELGAFGAAGGGLLIDCQPGGAGRDGGVLARISAAAEVDVVAATGFHLRQHHAPGGVWDDPAGAAERFVAELELGLPEAPSVRAGVVKVAWTGAGGVEDELLAAAAGAARRGGVPLIVHVEPRGDLAPLLDLLQAAGLAPGAVQLSHLDQRPDAALHAELARAGYVLGYDTFMRPHHRPEERVWPLLDAMLAAGLDGQVTLALDLVRPEAWSVNGGPGLRALLALVLPEVRRRGATDAQVRGLAGGNVRALLRCAREAVVG